MNVDVSNKTFWALTFELHVIFSCYEMCIFLLMFFQTLRNIQIILTLQGIQKQAVHWIFAAACARTQLHSNGSEKEAAADSA